MNNFKKGGLIALLILSPLSLKAQDTTKIKLNLPKLETKTQEFKIPILQSKTQYNLLEINKPNMILFTEYETPAINYKPKIEIKDVPYLNAGIKVKF